MEQDLLMAVKLEAHKDNKVKEDHRVYKVFKVFLAKLVHKDNKVKEVLKVIMVYLVHKDNKVKEVQRVNPVKMVREFH